MFVRLMPKKKNIYVDVLFVKMLTVFVPKKKFEKDKNKAKKNFNVKF
jgi:hypothetical protein